MSWGLVAGAAVTVIGGAIANNQSNNAAKDAANSQQAAQQAAIDEQRRQFDLTQQNLSPYMNWGASAIPLLGQLNAGDYSGFLNSPDYKSGFQQGQNAIDSSAAAKGGLFGGGHTKDSIAFGSDYANQYLNGYRNSLFQQAGMGQNAAAGLGGLGANMANQIGNAYSNIGNAQANAYGTIGNNNAQFTAGAFGTLGNLASNYISGYGG